MTGSTSRRPLVAVVGRYVRQFAMGQGPARWVLGFLIIMTILILTAPTRTIQLQARTLSLELELAAEPLAWDLTGAVVCTPTLDLMAPATAPCGAGEVFAATLDGPISWPLGQQLALDKTPAHLRIRLLSDGNGWPAGTSLILGPEDSRRNGALAFSGYLLLGQEMSAGSTGYVLDGSYAIYEQGLISTWIGWSPDITRAGVIRRGDQVQIICAPKLFQSCAGPAMNNRDNQFRNPVAASVSVDHDGLAGVHVVATGAQANSLLEVAYAGRDSILLIKPSWVQRAAASSSLLALSLLFSLLAPLLLPILNRSFRKD